MPEKQSGDCIEVLIVDDDITSRYLVAAALEQAGMAVTEAGDGREALHVLAQGPLPDILLLDVMMPVMDGFATCARRSCCIASVIWFVLVR